MIEALKRLPYQKRKFNYDIKRAQVDKFVNQFEIGYWPPLAMLGALVEEMGEISRILNAKEGHKPMKTNNKDLDELLNEEIGDALFSIACLANYYKIDMHKSLENTINKYNKRDNNRWTKKEDMNKLEKKL